MSQYSEVIGSFIRVGLFPLEANYIFESEAALKEFYSKPENYAILHKGLLKVVADPTSGELSLYWVVRKETNDELEFKKLISANTTEELQTKLLELLEKLEQEIKDRETADDAIWGSTDHTLVPSDLNSLLELANAIQDIREELSTWQDKLDSIKEELKAVVGTDMDDIIEYLKTLDYQSLTAVSLELHRFLHERSPETDTIDTFPELLDFLEGYKDTDKLVDVLKELVDNIMGDPLPTEPFRTLRGIEDFVRTFKSESENADANLLSELDLTLVGVGLSGDGSYNADLETYYLRDATSVMNALKILDSLINEAINNCNILVMDTNTVDLTLDKSPTLTLLQADVKISTELGNGIIAKQDGLFYKLTTEYSKGVLTVKVNDTIISVHDLGISTIVSSAKYDPDLEALVIVFELHDGTELVLTIPVGALVREWEVDNSYPNKVVELAKEEVIGGGPDKLSADVRLYTDKYLILVKKGNALYVKGTTDNLAHNDQKLSDVIDSLLNKDNELSQGLLDEIDRATAAEEALDLKITDESLRALKVEELLQHDLNVTNNKVTQNTENITNLLQDLTKEVERAKLAETLLDDKIDLETQRALASEENLLDLIDDINTTINNNSSDISELLSGLLKEIERATKAESDLDSKIESEIDRAKEAENLLAQGVNDLNTRVEQNSTSIVTLSDGLREEIERAKAAEQANTDRITLESNRAIEKENAIELTLNNHIKDYSNPHKVTKEQIGLGKVDNTSDLEKPVSVALQAAIDEVLDAVDGVASDFTNHIHDYNNPHKVTKGLVGLDKVDNTSDLEKPISVATQDALNTKADKDYVNGQLDTKAPIDSPVFKGNPLVENPPEIGDNSNRIPTTNWVVSTIEDLAGNSFEDHIHDYNNPHKVTAEQVNTYTKDVIDDKLDGKADLVDGKIPEDLLPDDVKNSVHYEGTWDASTNSPQLTPGDNTLDGNYYIVTTGGTFDGEEYSPGDVILNAGGLWIKIDNTDLVTSVNGKIGDVIINIEDIENLQEILNSKADASNVYTKELIDKKFDNLELSTTLDITEIREDITNLLENKADLVDGKVPESLLPDSVKGCVKYMGEWDATNNNPPLSDTDKGKEGWYYIVSEEGRLFSSNFKVGDWVVNSGGKWTKVNNADAVSSVNGLTGEVQINIEDIPGLLEAIDEGGQGLYDHIHDYNNPHKVTKDLLGLSKVENYSPAEMPISNAVQTEITRIDNSIGELGTDLSAHIKDYNNPHQVNKSQVGLDKVDNTSDLEKPISIALLAEFNAVHKELDLKALLSDLLLHILNYNNPHKVTKDLIGLGKVDNTSDLEKPISIAVQEALNEIKLEATGYATKEELNNHINDKMNPHLVTADLVGLGNVDNTSDLDKPISTATLHALDEKADIHHTHTMADIVDLENLPIIKGFVEVLSELPEQATGGDKYIMTTLVGSGATRYTLVEYDGSNGTWKLKLLTTGGIACVIGGEVWKLTSEGIQRILDADDYKYFYDKMWNETKDLVQSIEWDESTKDKIRLKVTTKKAYTAPNTDEATAPTVEPKVTYIDIEKERFLSSAYSRPATEEDVRQGYASKVGVPVLVVEFTTGDETVIDLTDTLNIYDPVDTSSVDMSVSNWTGDPSTSYKISANVRIAENNDAVKIVDSNNNGIYARLDKKNTYSVQLVDDGSLSANLVIDTALNNASDVALSIGPAGLSAKFVWGEYD